MDDWTKHQERQARRLAGGQAIALLLPLFLTHTSVMRAVGGWKGMRLGVGVGGKVLELTSSTHSLSPRELLYY